MSKALTTSLLLSVLLTACAGRAPLATSFPTNREADLRAVLARTKAAPRQVQRAVVVGVTEGPRAAFAYDLDARRLLWSIATNVTGVPVAAGDFVVVPEGPVVRIRALDTGAVVHEVASDGMYLVGADGDGRITAVVLSTTGSMGARSRVILLDGPRVSWNELVDRGVGGPAVVGGLAFLPHNRVHLSVLDPEGRELARALVRGDVASQAIARDSDVYFGLAGIYRLDERLRVAETGATSYFRPQHEEKLPGQPSFLPDTTTPPAPPDSAVQHVALSWVPTHDERGIGLADDTLYLVFYRQLYALEPNALRARWVFQTPTDAVALRAVPGGVLVVDDHGDVTSLDVVGRAHPLAQMGVRPLAARVRAERFDPSSTATAPLPAPLTMQLMDAALSNDTRLVPARAMAVQMLAALDDPEATTGLIEICQDRTAPERIQKGACVALSKRTTGSDAIVEALGRHADFLTGAEAPPVGPLAEAALNTRDARAVTPLLGQLEDPETPTDELPALMRALKALADPSAFTPIADFLRLYHADAEEAGLSDALVIAIDALTQLRGAEAQHVLEPIANDSLSAPSVRSAAARALAAASTAPNEAMTAGDPPEPTGEAVAPTEEARPSRLTAAHVDAALAPLKLRLSQCLRDAAAHPANVRLTLMVEPSGEIAVVKTLPDSVQGCVEPLVRTAKLPATTWKGRDTLNTTITR